MGKVKKKSKAERKEALKKNTENSAKNADKGFSGKRLLDTSGLDEVKFWRPEKGNKNKVSLDIIPYVVQTKHHPQKIKPGYNDYRLDVFVHRYIGPGDDTFLCLKKTFGKPCPICEHEESLQESGQKKASEGFKAKRRCVYNIIDMNDIDAGIQLFEESYWLFEKEMLEEAETSEDQVITFSDLEDGRNVRFRPKTDSYEGNSFFKYKSFTFPERDEAYEDDFDEEAYCLDELMIIPTYEEMQAALKGEGEDEDEDEVDNDLNDDAIPFDVDEKSKCPIGKYGETDDHKECKNCDVWDDCADEQERLAE